MPPELAMISLFGLPNTPVSWWLPPGPMESRSWPKSWWAVLDLPGPATGITLELLNFDCLPFPYCCSSGNCWGLAPVWMPSTPPWLQLVTQIWWSDLQSHYPGLSRRNVMHYQGALYYTFTVGYTAHSRYILLHFEGALYFTCNVHYTKLLRCITPNF